MKKKMVYGLRWKKWWWWIYLISDDERGSSLPLFWWNEWASSWGWTTSRCQRSLATRHRWFLLWHFQFRWFHHLWCTGSRLIQSNGESRTSARTKSKKNYLLFLLQKLLSFITRILQSGFWGDKFWEKQKRNKKISTLSILRWNSVSIIAESLQKSVSRDYRALTQLCLRNFTN